MVQSPENVYKIFKTRLRKEKVAVMGFESHSYKIFSVKALEAHSGNYTFAKKAKDSL